MEAAARGEGVAIAAGAIRGWMVKGEAGAGGVARELFTKIVPGSRSRVHLHDRRLLDFPCNDLERFDGADDFRRQHHIFPWFLQFLASAECFFTRIRITLSCSTLFS